MLINENTKIATLLKAHPKALDKIISLSPKFTKLRNPILRKLMAGRTSIAMAAKIGSCHPTDFFEVLKPLGFTAEENHKEVPDINGEEVLPDFIKNMDKSKLVELDVRPIINGDGDPLSLIIKTVKDLPAGNVLKIINSFEPTPLISMLGKKGFKSYIKNIDSNTVHAYFYKTADDENPNFEVANDKAEDWEGILKKYEGNIIEIDVRHLEMPLPMHTILDNLKFLPNDKALLVQHKRIPVFLLPELKDLEVDYRIKEEPDGAVWLLLFKEILCLTVIQICLPPALPTLKQCFLFICMPEPFF